MQFASLSQFIYDRTPNDDSALFALILQNKIVYECYI